MSLESLVVAAFIFLLSSGLTYQLSSSGSTAYLLDYPNERSLHSLPTPRTGGVAVLGGLFVGLLVSYACHILIGVQWLEWLRVDYVQVQRVQWILFLTACVAVVSLVDNRMSIPPGIRFVIHSLVASIVVVGVGVRIDSIAIPLVGKWMLGEAATLVTILFIVWIVNLYNFMDGMDGFAGGMTVIGFSCLSVSAWIGQDVSLATLTLFIAASAGGFLVYNLPPARIFMGDVGSISLGFLAGAISVVGVHSNVFDVWVPILIFSPFIMDATVTLLRRLCAGKKVWLPHREHYYQRLVLCGWGSKKTMWVEYALMSVCGSAGLLYTVVGDPGRLVVLCVWVLLYVSLIAGVRIVEQKECRKHARSVGY